MTARLPLRVLATLLVLITAAMLAKVGWSGYGPGPGQKQLDQQIRFLSSSIAAGSAHDMQRLFPEGFFFMHALTAMAAARAEDPDLEQIREQLEALDSPEVTQVFGSGMVPEHGIFQAGWALTLAVDLAELSRSPADLADVRSRTVVINDAIAGSTSGFLAGYPGQYWPCDTVVAASALARAAALVPGQGWLATLRSWRQKTTQHYDPATGLLPHRVDVTGSALDAARGSSQSIIQTFWPDIEMALDGKVDLGSWHDFTTAFVDRRFGLVGVREYPAGTNGQGDVDSGPLIAGISASASAVTLAAARRVGDVDLAGSLDREAELLGLPIALGGQRSYAFSQLPIGDAFLAWARSRPLPTSSAAVADGSPKPWWVAFLLLALIPAAVSVPAWRAARRR